MFENREKRSRVGRFLSVPLDTMSGYEREGGVCWSEGPAKRAPVYSPLRASARALDSGSSSGR